MEKKPLNSCESKTNISNLFRRFKIIILRNRIAITIMLIALFIVIIPILNKSGLAGDDADFHYARIKSIADALKSGNFNMRIFPNFANSYGYGWGLFYCSFFLYIPVLALLITNSINNAMKILMLFSICAMMFTTYISTKHITKNKKTSIIATILVITSYYILTDIYFRFAVGEYIALVFVPLIIAGMWDFVYNDFKKPSFLVIGFIGVIFSHVITVGIMAGYCLLYLLVNIKKVFKNKKNILKLLFCAIIVACITMTFWLPMIEQMADQSFRYEENESKAQGISLFTLFSDEKYSMGYMQTIVVFGGLLLLIKNWKKTNLDIKQFFICGLLIIIPITLNRFWTTFEKLQIIQFSWRLLGLVAILTSISFSQMLVDYKNSKNLIIISIILVLLFCQIGSKNLVRFKDFNKQDIYKQILSLGGSMEYLPKNSLLENKDMSKLNFPNEAINDRNEKITGIKDGLSFEFNNNRSDKEYLIPFFYYKGYKAKLIDNLDNEKMLEVNLGKDGLVKVKNVNEDGKIVVWYDGTTIQRVSDFVSISSIIILSFGLISKKIKLAYNKK